MEPDQARQVFQSFFGLERRGTTTRFLNAILISVIIVDTVMILFRLWNIRSLSDSVTWVLLILLFLQILLLIMVRNGFVDLAAYLLVVSSWVAVTYLIWIADGVRDVAFYLYFVILLFAALLTSWRLFFFLSLLSIGSI